MWRTILLGLGLAVAAYVAINLIVTTDLERVEEEIGHLVDLANEGGEAAVDGILAALADDYRGTPPFERESVERYLRRYVGDSKSRTITTGNPKPIWKGDEIFVPLLSVRATVDGATRQVILSLTFAERDGRWRIVDISRAEWGR